MATATLVKSLHRKRGNLKHRLTTLHKFCTEISIESLSGEELTEKINLVQLRLKQAQEISLEFQQIQQEIEENCEDATLNQEYGERDQFEFSIQKSISKLERIVKSVQTHSDINQVSDLNQTNSSNLDNQVKLPIIKLPTFNGVYTDWLEFKELFVSLIHSNKRISNAQKFHYLRAALGGNAEKAIQGVHLSSDNYDTVWNLLCKRYDNKEILIHEHIKAIFDTQHTSTNESKGFRNMLDELNKHQKYLSQLGDHMQQRNALLIFILSNKLDKVSLKDWEEFVNSNQGSSLDNFEKFLLNKAEVLEKLEQRSNKLNSSVHINIPKRQGFLSTNVICQNCKQNHQLYQCKEFIKLTPKERFEKIKILKLCTNCLRAGHISSNCNSSRCKRCNKSHNTLLHFEGNTVVKCDSTSNVMTSLVNHNHNTLVLLSTIRFKTLAKDGSLVEGRALLDNGSQSNFVTYQFIEKLGIPLQESKIPIVGIGNVASIVKHNCTVPIQSNFGKFKGQVNCSILNQISDNVPNFKVDTRNITIPNNINLADQNYFDSAPVDMLIGAELFWEILRPERIKLGKDLPSLQNTVFGWIFTGIVHSMSSFVSCCNFSLIDLHNNIQNFWNVEENYDKQPELTIDEQKCEFHFQNTYSRKQNGKFVVSIPFKQSPKLLGNSAENALKRFYKLEQKLAVNSSLREQYIHFMEEYKNLGHMSKLTRPIEDSDCYYLPHHAVLKSDSLTTKCRVVFDGSALTDNGLSLNSIQYIGAIQDDLMSIILRFREHEYVFTADICKMYRQIEIVESERKYQRIFWRSNPNKELDVYELKTVTYGTASAPYLATRCIKQLSYDNMNNCPLAAEIISRDFYIDDLISGSNTIENASKLVDQISTILLGAGFKLTKWCSNKPEVLASVKNINQLSHYINVGEISETKLLGLQWEFISDSLTFTSNNCINNTLTKRTILSNIAKIFDPLGLVAPSITLVKLIMQELWSRKAGWDDEIPSDIKARWLLFRTNLEQLNKISIPRLVFCNSPITIELHGFSDASQEAYGSCIYARSTNCSGKIYAKLFCAKGKIAPLKALSVPRLELCGAVILARLMQKLKSALTVNVECYYWTDSQVVLAWLNNQSRLFHIFVSNRIAEIQRITKIENWAYVSTHENPADIVSRGMQINDLVNSRLWWEGPLWLSKAKHTWPTSDFSTVRVELPERKLQVNTVVVKINNNLINRFSSLTTLKRTIAYCYRFINNCKERAKSNREIGELTTHEIKIAFLSVIKLSQKFWFSDEINTLKSQQQLHVKDKLGQFNPFLDAQELLRVGGRIQNANLLFDQTHPIILHSKCHLTQLILKFEHLRNYHAGPQHLLYVSRQKFWIIGGRSLAKKIVRNCITCFRAKPKFINPLMGNLPSVRIQPSYPFLHTGTDFAGPFFVRDRKGRGHKTFKCYICLFVCMSVKALHLEVITDLVTETFLLAFRRFRARRGQPINIYSDNGKTFIKASSHLRELGIFLQKNQKYLSENLVSHEINWQFIPAYSPNFGGLWEAGVKSTKFHLKRVIGNASITLEQFMTIITEIEGILNSRPIASMSNDPSDFQALSPGHFLIGRPVTSIIEPNILEIPQNRLSSYQRVEQIRQHFWQRWSKEYVSELQCRNKWKKANSNIQENSLVLIKDNNLSPLCWKIGRIIKVHPGSDGVIRVVTVKTPTGVVKRATSQVCILPLENN